MEQIIRIHKYEAGMSNGYFAICEGGAYAVDTGAEIGVEAALKYIGEAGLKPEDIKLIVITHGHSDHYMNIEALAKVTKAPVLCHKNAAPFLEEGLSPYSDIVARNEIGRAILERDLGGDSPVEYLPKYPVDYKIDDDGLDLAQFGLCGKIVFTPGHSRGCISIVLGKEAIVGDLFGAPAFSDDVGMPFFTYNGASFEEAQESVQKLLDMGVEKFHFGHGNERDRQFVETILAEERAKTL